MKASPTPAQPATGIRYCSSCLAVYRQDFPRCPFDGASLVVGAHDPWIGVTVGTHYAIDALVGEGAMGRVYRAHHTQLVDRHYAIKILIGDLAATAQMRARFQQEAEHASKLAHPNVVGVIDYGATDKGVSYIVMDLVEGPSLGAIVQQGPMAPERVLKLARQLCEGLEHAHGRGMIHRDFKPDNILVLGDGDLEVARIADFGLALSTETPTRLTTTGIVCTPAYAAPEQLRGETIDARVDLYALGTTMYEMLSGGMLPFNGDIDASVRSKLMHDAPTVLLVAPNVPPALVSIVGRLLSSDPARRPRSARAVIRALDGAIAAPRSILRTEQTLPLRAPTNANAVVDASDSGKLPNKAAAITRPETRARKVAARASANKRTMTVSRGPRFGRTLVQLFAVGITIGGGLAWFGLRGPGDVGLALNALNAPMRAEAAPAEPAPVVATQQYRTEPPPVRANAAAPVVEYTIARAKAVTKPVAKQARVVGHKVARAAVPAGNPDLMGADFDASTELDANMLARRYAAIARALHRLDDALGHDNTDDLWTAFRSIHMTAAMSIQESRNDAAATLAEIQEAILDRSSTP